MFGKLFHKFGKPQSIGLYMCFFWCFFGGGCLNKITLCMFVKILTIIDVPYIKMH